jgi:hypothetical protein
MNRKQNDTGGLAVESMHGREVLHANPILQASQE